MKKCTSVLLTLLLFFTSFLPFLQTPLTPQKAYAEENCIYYVYEVGNKVRSTEYDPFGNWRAANGQANIHMLYQSQQQDPESSLYYLRARYYDPLIGRFISKDPVKGSLTLPQSQNPYAYAGNNPVNRSDPSGKFWDYALDAVFIGMDIANCDWGAAVVDTALGVLPGVPAVFGVTKRAGQAVNAIDNAVDASRQFTKLSDYEVKQVEKVLGQDVHQIKGKGGGELDLFKDSNGDVRIMPKDGSGQAIQ